MQFMNSLCEWLFSYYLNITLIIFLKERTVIQPIVLKLFEVSLNLPKGNLNAYFLGATIVINIYLKYH